MIIKRLTLFNIGPYLNENIFDFSSSRDKNIVLIGGKNGAGKTTFFKAIKTCLYGCKVWGYDAPGKEYYSKINSLVNFKTQFESSTKAYVELEIVFDNGKESNSYVLHREWTKLKMTLSEFFHIRKNGEIILGSEEEDFVNYLLSVIPPDMFNFYFFDGESIAEFFLGSDGNKNFRNAFLKLYGLDTLSIMVENFARHLKKSSSASSYDNYISSKVALEKAEENVTNLQKEIKDIEDKIDLLHIKLQSLQNEYSKSGGIGISDWKQLNSELLREENQRDSLNKWLKDVANNYLPFVILEKQLSILLTQITDEQEQQRLRYLVDVLTEDTFSVSLANYLTLRNISSISSNELIKFFADQVGDVSGEFLFDFSSNQINKIVSQIFEKQGFDKTQIKKVITKLNTSLKTTKKLREKMIGSSIEGYEGFIAEKESIEHDIHELTLILERKIQELDREYQTLDEAKSIFAKAKISYEETLKNKSITNLAERATATYSLLEEQLVRRQAKILQDEFVTCFRSIINKDNFIDGIVIDKNINIIPYKFVSITRSQIQNYRTVNKDFLELFDKVHLIMQINKLELAEVDEIFLPAPIKAPFSQGERQVYIMSIYLALLKTSHKDIPFFIDTPFARIDSKHRASIVNEFFNKIKNQLFILSTDEEIVDEYKKMLMHNVSDLYTLEISDYGTTKIKPDVYFGE